MTADELRASRRLDALIGRLERGGCWPPLRWWLRWQQHRLERRFVRGYRHEHV